MLNRAAYFRPSSTQMAFRIAPGLLFFVLFSTSVLAQKLSLEQIMADPKWIGTQPSQPIWSADGKTLYWKWNPDKKTADSLYKSTAPNWLPVKAKPEEEKELAASRGQFSADRSQLVYSYRGDLYLRQVVSGKEQRLTRTRDFEQAPTWIESEKAVAFLRDGNLYKISPASGRLDQLTDIRSGSAPNSKPDPGLPADQLRSRWEREFLQTIQQKHNKNQEANRNKLTFSDTLVTWYSGSAQTERLSLSPDGKQILWQTWIAPSGIQNTQVPAFVTASSYTKDLPTRPNVGTPLGEYKLQIWNGSRFWKLNPATLPGISPKPDFWADYPQLKDSVLKTRPVYLGRHVWSPQGSQLALELLSHDNKDRWILVFRADTFQVAEHRRDEAWIGGPGVEEGFLEWQNENQILFQSEETGFSHLYRYSVKERKREALSTGTFEIQDARLAADRKSVLVVANPTAPGTQGLYAISLTAKPTLLPIKTEVGGYELCLSPTGTNLAYRFSTSTQPWELFVVENGKSRQLTTKARSAEFDQLRLAQPEIVAFKAADSRIVHARLYRSGVKNGPGVIFVHGAGYLQNAHTRWSNYFREMLFHRFLNQQGITVLDIDYCGSAGYGRDWRTGIYRHMGGKDLSDQLDGKKFLVDSCGVDPEKTGIYGGSYGGFITLMALFKHPGAFTAGAALRSVTDWTHYNHGYTSNILNEPQLDSLAYRRSSPIWFADGLQDKLLICHGMVDENVHFQDVVRLSQKLIELKKKNWEMAVFPVEDHGFVEPASWLDEYRRIWELFRDTLLNQK